MDKLRNILKGLFNRYTILLLFTYFVFGVSFSYAYFAFREENNSTIVGNVVAIDADLDVELVVGTNTKMVPMTDDALSNAINGEGGQSACVDANGNLSCQVYKITFTNNASRLQHINGSIELYAKSGNGNTYSNLKWRELTNTTTVNESSVVNGMSKSTLVSDITMETNETRTWYIAVWISETDYDQVDTDKGQFGGTVTFETVSTEPNAFAKTIMIPNAESDQYMDFFTSTDSGIYLRSGTENDTYPIYYYRGDVDNNLIFADMCWKVVRTTETGGLKLLYNGFPSGDGACNNTGEDTIITTSYYDVYIDENNLDINGNVKFFGTGSGYMRPASISGRNYYYNSVDANVDDRYVSYLYANDVVYQNGEYTLIDIKDNSGVESWRELSESGLENYHYTCLSSEIICENVYYLVSTEPFELNYYELSNGTKIEDVLDDLEYMFGKEEDDSSIYNTESSTIKAILDSLYRENIGVYNNNLEDTIWCYDREIHSIGSLNPNGGPTYNSNFLFTYGGYINLYNNGENIEIEPLTCSRDVDKFTVREELGNGDLDYPIGLLTLDEVVLGGSYLYSGVDYWLGTLIGMKFDLMSFIPIVSIVSQYGGFDFKSSVESLGVRPSISLKNDFELVGDGNGSVENPYVVSTTFEMPAYLNQVISGSYVKYVGDSNNGCDNTNTVNGYTSCAGKNANYVSDTDMGSCYSSSYKFSVNGWRVGYVEDGSAHLVSAGATDCMCTSEDGTTSNSDCGSSLNASDLYKHFDNMDNIALKYCNKDYAKGGVCNNSTAWAMDTTDFEKITGKALNLCKSNVGITNVNCGFFNTLIDNGGGYWFATPYSALSSSIFTWMPSSRIVGRNISSISLEGVRPVLALDPSIRVIGGTGTYKDPYMISN